MRIGSLFSGIGGLELGLERAGLGHTVWQVEQSEFCRSVLARHWPDAERFEDVTEFKGAPAELICGGFPCQDVSSAGKGAGLAGSRSGLWYQFHRIVTELRPEWVVVENVASGASRWVDAVRLGLEQSNYETLPIPLSAFDVGAPHLRRRVFIVARNTDRDSEPAQPVDAEVAGVSGDSGSAANAERIDVREQSRRCCGPHGQGETLAGLAGEDGEAADAMRPRLQGADGRAYEGWQEPTARAWSKDAMPKPALCRVDDGPAAWVDRNKRLRALGNAVIPQCAEVIGHVIKELCK